jgi:hypothetical protein
MITYQKLLKKPQVAKSLVGMPLVEFDKFYAEFEKTHEERLASSTTTRTGKKKRQRATGAGRNVPQVRFARPLIDDLVLVESLYNL